MPDHRKLTQDELYAEGRPFRIEVADRHGAVALLIDPPALTGAQQARVDHLADQAIGELAALPGVNGLKHAREILLGELTRQYADQLAYERVAAQRGLLPL